MNPVNGIGQVNFGEVLRYYRKRENISQEYLADGICSREYIVQIEKGGNIPTLYMIYAFSKRMGINLFDAYAMIVEHNDLDTHSKIEKLNEVIALRDDAQTYRLAVQYSELPGFTHGVPLQCIRHAFSLYYSNVLHDYDRSIAYATEGLTVSGINRPEDIRPSALTNTDMCLLLVKSVDLCRAGRMEEGRQYLEALYDSTKNRIQESRYIANRNRRFDISMLATAAYNLCEFFPDDADRNIHYLEETIQLLRKFRCDNMWELLILYKARYLFDRGKPEEARRFFIAGYYSMLTYSSQESVERCANKILQERLEILRTAEQEI